MNWQQRIREEFGTSALTVIRSFAGSGYSKRLTAGSLGISINTLRKYAEQHGIVFASKKDMRPECKGGGVGWPKGKPRGYSNNPAGRNQWSVV